jgi:nicotinate phosphoribosyltransferase
LIDTYDDLKGAENAAIVAKELEKKGYRLNAVRLDSGDLLSISQKVRQVLDDRGLNYVKIFASGDLDEHVIEELLKEGAKIDAFGVGTRMGTSLDRPYVDVVYKLSGKVEEGNFVPTMKLSKGKVTLPGKKQIFRQIGKNRRYVRDIIGLEDEEIEGDPLLNKVMKDGCITCEVPRLQEVREATLENLSRLPEKYKRLRNPCCYPVELSHRLTKIRSQVVDRLRS